MVVTHFLVVSELFTHVVSSETGVSLCGFDMREHGIGGARRLKRGVRLARAGDAGICCSCCYEVVLRYVQPVLLA